MNILTDRLPSSVKVGSTTFDIETDFRAGVSFALMAESGENNIFKLCQPFFPNGFPFDIRFATEKEIREAVEAVLYFFRCGDEIEEKEQPKQSKPAYSYKVDSEAIYADFWRFYNVDLSQDNLHWWTFRNLLMGLPEDSNFKTRIYYRTCKLSDLPKKEQRRIASIRKQIEIKQTENGSKLTLEQRNKQMLDYVKKRSEELRG